MNSADSTADSNADAGDGANPGVWSTAMRDRFGVTLPADLVDWLDGCDGSSGHSGPLWSMQGPGEFRYPATPQSLLSEVPDAVWPPLMPPNFLPLLGNGAGDWLCLRLLDPDVAATTGRKTDVCHWYHGGGDWLPWGDSLAEALLFDWTLPNLPQPTRRHADPAEPDGFAEPLEGDPSPEPHCDETIDETSCQPIWHRDHPWVHWAKKHLPAINQIDSPEIDSPVYPTELGNQLLELGLCEVPVRCQLAIDCLDSGVLNQLEPKAAHRLGLSWNDLMRWCFDLKELPTDAADRLTNDLGIAVADFDPAQQRWDEIERHAEAVTRRAADLSWGHDLLGYCRLRSGDLEAADASFRRAIRCSVFTDQSVRLRTHWATASDGFAKFAARFLSEEGLGSPNECFEPQQLGVIPHQVEPLPLWKHLGKQTSQASENGDSIRHRYSAMLIDAARQATDPAMAARLYYSAGWDLGAEPLRCYGDLLDNYIAACHDAGSHNASWRGHEQLARVHRQGLKARYNL